MQNIGVAFIKTGQYIDACSSFEHIMSMSPNLKAGFNLILCYFAVGNSEQMKKAFQNLIAVPLEVDYEDKYISPNVSLKKINSSVFKQNKLCLCIVNEEKGGEILNAWIALNMQTDVFMCKMTSIRNLTVSIINIVELIEDYVRSLIGREALNYRSSFLV